MAIVALIISIGALIVALRAAGYARQLQAYWYQMMKQTLEEVSRMSIDEILHNPDNPDNYGKHE